MVLLLHLPANIDAVLMTTEHRIMLAGMVLSLDAQSSHGEISTTAALYKSDP